MVDFQKLSYCVESLHMTSEGLGEMFQGDSANRSFFAHADGGERSSQA